MKTFCFILAFFSSCFLYAQTAVLQETNTKMNNEDGDEVSTFEPDSNIVIPEEWDINFNNLLNSWYVQHYTNKVNNVEYQDNTPVNDSIYMKRLSEMPNEIELPYNNTVRKCIDLYVERRRSLVEYMLGLEPFYFPMIEETLGKYDLPLELKYLVIIESAMNPVALSRAGASGLWQFIISTGRNYGLEINSLIDERRDPIKSTDAACRYLRDLYNTYGDWYLAIAAYNCGGGNVNKAIKRANGKKDYWAIYPYLPKETRSYVPFFIAANYVMYYYAYHQLYPVQTSLPLATDTIMVNQIIHFDQIASVLQIDKELIRALNPQYKRDIIPGNYKPQILKLPAMQAYSFVEKENEIANYRADELFTNRKTNNESTLVSHNEKIIHRVSSGESVTSIANRYGVAAADIRKWNGLISNKVSAGKRLILYVDNGGYTISANAAETKPAPKPANSSINSRDIVFIPKNSTVKYKVRPGDTFYTIAQKYPGFSHTDLMKLNNASKASLKVGQYILVPKI